MYEKGSIQQTRGGVDPYCITATNNSQSQYGILGPIIYRQLHAARSTGVYSRADRQANGYSKLYHRYDLGYINTPAPDISYKKMDGK